jgi:hypothetical protein
MHKQILKVLGLLAASLILAACTKGPSKTAAEGESEPQKPAAPPAPIAARNAFFEMYKPARSWAPDLFPLTLTSGELPGIKNERGKAALWTAVFVSPSRREARTLTYAVAEAGGTLKGVTVGGPQPWSGATPKSKPFQVTEFLIDSDEAYKIAMKTAGPWVQKHPDKKLSMFLANASKYPGPLWYVLWGNTKSGYLVHINATTGALVKLR